MRTLMALVGLLEVRGWFDVGQDTPGSVCECSALGDVFSDGGGRLRS